MPYRRTDLEVEEVSFVDRPAVPSAKIFFTKRLSGGKRVSILKMNGGTEVQKKREGFKKAFQAAKEKFQKAVKTITETLEGEMAEDQFWEQLYDIMSAFWDVLYDIMEDDTVTDKAAAMNTLIDELGVKLKEAAGILSGTTKGANMEQGKVLEALEGVGKKLDGLAERVGKLEKKPETETAGKAAEGKPEAGAAPGEDAIGKALEEITGKLETMDKRVGALEGQPEQSAAIKGQELDQKEAFWTSFNIKR
jgi:hypothetical protein